MVAHVRKAIGKLSRAVDRVVDSRSDIGFAGRFSRRQIGFEQLENRRLMTLLGVAPDVPAIAYDQSGVINYNAGTGEVDLSATALAYIDTLFNVYNIDNGTVTLHFNVNSSGALTGGVPGDDLVVTGDIDTDFDTNYDYTGVLLTAEIGGFGFQESGTTDEYDMRFSITGGALAAEFAGNDLGMLVTSENSTFNNDFSVSFSGGAKGTMGLIPPDAEPLGSISGIKYRDVTGNGVTPDDTPLAGTTINLYNDVNGDGQLTGADGAPIASDVTDGSGAYSFDALAMGKYIVQEIVPAGYSQTAPGSITHAVTLSAESEDNDLDGLNFANVQLSNISGVKYKDLTGNGLSGDDTPLAGTTINLYKDVNNDGQLTGADGAAIDTKVSAAGTGAYSFIGLLPGQYLIQEIVPPGYGRTTPNTATGVIVANITNGGSSVTGQNFANAKLADISGKKYKDNTGNGITYDDTPLSGTTINLFKDTNNDGFLTGADGAAIASAVSAAGTGTYSFTNLLPGTYFVQEVVPAGYQQTFPNPATYTVNLAGHDATGKNFANKLVSGSISGNKYFDCCGDGLTSDDNGMGGVTIKLFRDVNNDGQLTSGDGGPIATTVTSNGTGAYSFTGLAAGNYFVQEVTPSGFVRTAPTNSDKYYVQLSNGQNVGGKNFANAEIHDCVDDIKYVKYYVNGVQVDTLLGNTHQGDVVKVTFTVKTGVSPERWTLVSYKAPSPAFIASEAYEQKIFDIDSKVWGPGTYSLSVTIPDSYYQVDFICGCAIEQFGPEGSNIFYTPQKRLLAYDNAGTNSDIDGLSKGPAYWASTAGQNLIKGLNGGSTSKQLATWMAQSFPKLYGSQAGSYNLTNKTNVEVANNIKSLYNGGSTKEATAQAMAIAISMWVSTISQGGNTAAIQAAGFRPTAAGLSTAIFNVLNDGAAFDTSNNTSHSVLNLMKDCNDNAVNGLLYSSSSTLRESALDVLEAITNNGDIDVV